jgi:two-component system chemotaxis response regulator CheY
MCEIICKILRQTGFTKPEYVTEGIDALQKLRSTPYGLLLTDLEMNPISGIELIKLIWADRDILPIPVVLTSANHKNMAKALGDAQRQMADIYILKPFTAESLDRKLHAAFGG